ncbi:MAG: UDP-N-acetylmuramate dehydrogenase [Gammaproteobacteria bacterium]|nr:UDP-N-acetylmuramate dehydrogenase [Gammaproteobacteria bacterium]
MRFIPNHSLASLNTFGFDQSAEWYCEAASLDDMHEALEFATARDLPVFILGGGSNIVLTDNVPGLTIHQTSREIHYSQQDDTRWVSAHAGVNWHHLVLDSIKHGYNGLENLSLIPGDAGAAPIQNIGAYGVELAQRLISVEIMHLASGEVTTLLNEECQFGYRDSIFKQQLRKKVAVLTINLEIYSNNQLDIDYAGVAAELEKSGATAPTAKDVSEVICKIRRLKLPNPAIVGNAGSFFKNPVVEVSQFQKLKEIHTALPGFRSSPTLVKIPAAWLIEHCGWKGTQRGGIGVHQHQSLVLTHSGGSTGTELLNLSHDIRESVIEKFGIALEREPVQVP